MREITSRISFASAYKEHRIRQQCNLTSYTCMGLLSACDYKTHEKLELYYGAFLNYDLFTQKQCGQQLNTVVLKLPFM